MLSGSILLIDDETQLRSLLKRIISLEGFLVHEASNLKQAAQLLEKEQVDIVLCDVRLPDGSGVDFVQTVREKYAGTEIILITAFGNIEDGVQAMKNGAFDYLVKGNDNNKVIPLLHRALEKTGLQKRVRQLEKQAGKKYGFENIIGSSDAIRQAIDFAAKVAPTDTTVLLTGETGTGKEVFAQSIHYASPRKDKAFVALNCSAFSKELLESELFGHKAGAFTGATKDKKGLIEEAHLGTLFLDEIGEMHIDLQSKLLRVLETNEFIRVGDTKTVKVNVRVIAATNRDLQQEIGRGRFREDLFYRLNVFAISLPALRERPQDIPALANHYMQLYAMKTGKQFAPLPAAAIKLLQQYYWKGNIRELKNTIERAVILSDGPELQIGLPQLMPHTGSLLLSDLEQAHIRKILTQTNGNKTKAAELMGISLSTLYRKIEEYSI